MCRPTYFKIKYVINPWMQSQKVDHDKALAQWENLYKTYESLGIKIQLIDQVEANPDMVFTTDSGVFKDDAIVLSNFATKERQGEAAVFETWFEQRGYTVKRLPEGYFFEGGDFLFWHGSFFGGYGFRAEEKTLAEIGTALDSEVIPLHLVDNYYYHLDTCLMPVNDSLVFYQEPAFAPESIALLKKRIPQLIPFTKKQAASLCANGVISAKDVVCQNPDEEFKKIMADNGYNVITVDVSEFNKSCGGIHCLTKILKAE